MISSLNDDFLFWLEGMVYNSSWELDCDMLAFLLGDNQ